MKSSAGLLELTMELSKRSPGSPPPYEAQARTHHHHHHRRRPRLFNQCRLRRACLSAPVVLAALLLTTLSIAYLRLFLTTNQNTPTPIAAGAAPGASAKFQRWMAQCKARNHVLSEPEPGSRKTNPRWNSARGQNETVALRNATLFDGEAFLVGPVDIVFSRGLVVSVAPASDAASILKDGKEFNLQGRHVTPGIVDMHSHHLAWSWPSVGAATDDSNEMHPLFGPLTPFLRIADSLKPNDAATRLIASGGVTSSLVIPGSANTMGGEGTAVKNALRSGAHGEPVVEDMLLEHGVPPAERRRWMKMACGENPKGVYGHTRMGLAWMLRKHLARARDLMDAQDEWCEAAGRLSRGEEDDVINARDRFLERMGGLPEELELESTVALMRGRVAMHNHCYEPEDFETMLGVTREFDIRVRAFHHAVEAWQVPEMLKEDGGNPTMAIFAEYSLYKQEAYSPNLYAGAILNAHGLPVAYKSLTDCQDHAGETTYAKYLMSQAAAGHAFHLPAEKALQAVTSIPAKALDLGFRIGYVRQGYDADIVVWDDHPLSIGATPQQVFIDGIATLEPKNVENAMGHSIESSSPPPAAAEPPRMRMRKSAPEIADFCALTKKRSQSFVISGIRKSFLDSYPQFSAALSLSGHENLTMVIHNGQVTCIGSSETCSNEVAATNSDAVELELENGQLLPGLTAVSHNLGIKEIELEESTGNGIAQVNDEKNPAYIDHAKYGVYLDGKSFARARLGGVTRAITAPEFPSRGMLQGVSVGIKTSGTQTVLDGGIFQDDVGLHVIIGDINRNTGSISMAVKTLREILIENEGKGNQSAFGLVADGQMPLIVQVESSPEIQQMVAIKREFPKMSLVVRGGHEAPLASSPVARELAKARIPVLLSATRPSPEPWGGKNSLSGPPLSKSPARVLSEEGVQYAVSVDADAPIGDSRIHDLALEASWVAKYAGLSEHEAVRLVSTNVENILGLKPSKDIVIWENSPLQWGASVVLSFEESANGSLEVGSCWPDESADGVI